MSAIVGVIMMVMIFLAFIYLSQLVIKLLYFVTPVLLIITLIWDHRVVLGYLRWIADLVKRNPLMGIGAILLTLIGYPFVTLFLFMKAFLRRKVRQLEKEAERQREGEYVDFEEIEEVEEKPMELPELEKKKPPKKEDGYEKFFEE